MISDTINAALHNINNILTFSISEIYNTVYKEIYMIDID